MNPIPTMIALIALAFLGALWACQLNLISDLLLAAIVLALLIVLIATEPEPAASHPPPARRSFLG